VREAYDREKLQKGIEIACYRRPVSVGHVKSWSMTSRWI